MFDLDIRLFNLIYTQCRTLGNAFNMGAFEGFVMYAGVVTLGITKVLESNNKKVKKC
ncbi:hypothetical protein [Clostridium weizhouense]|uniref:Uncharacterized protein n=1 Tax=Clostridium weizhouense TaxID=2859781 RepID=A0ABS7AT65_9CLOT|nr:hypothetical protein [Clostridium weizhouense]MBW6411839.1 hypothetical protein [Clostridium weizhouense]